MVESVNLGHVALPVVLPREGFAARSRIVATLDRAMELALLLVPVVDVAHQMRLCAEALAAGWVRALMVFAMVSLVVFQLVRLVEYLVATGLVAAVDTASWRGNTVERMWRCALTIIGAVERFW